VALNANDKITNCLSEHNAFRRARVADKLTTEPIQKVLCASVLPETMDAKTLRALHVQVKVLRADVAEAKNVYSTLGKRMDVLDSRKSSAVMDEIVSGKHIQKSTDVEDEACESTPQAGEPTNDQKGDVAPLTNCCKPSLWSSPDSFEKMYNGLKTLLEAMGYTVVCKPGGREMSSLHDAVLAGFQTQAALRVNDLDINKTLQYMQECKDDARLSPYTMARVLAKIADTLVRHYHEYKNAIKFCLQAHECFKNTNDQSVELKVDQARNLCIGSICQQTLGWRDYAHKWAEKAQEILYSSMATTCEDTKVLQKVAFIENQCGISYYKYGTKHSKQLGLAYFNTALFIYKSLDDVESIKKVRENILETRPETEN
jgi:hypothetical protein